MQRLGKPQTSKTAWGADIILSPFASVAAVEKALIAARVLHSDRSWSYAKDHHFEAFVCSSIKSYAALENFLQQLEKAGKRRNDGSGKCTKAEIIRARLKDTFWNDEPSRIAALLSCIRRYTCICHETGSYAEYHRAKKEKRSFN